MDPFHISGGFRSRSYKLYNTKHCVIDEHFIFLKPLLDLHLTIGTVCEKSHLPTCNAIPALHILCLPNKIHLIQLMSSLEETPGCEIVESDKVDIQNVQC